MRKYLTAITLSSLLLAYFQPAQAMTEEEWRNLHALQRTACDQKKDAEACLHVAMIDMGLNQNESGITPHPERGLHSLNRACFLGNSIACGTLVKLYRGGQVLSMEVEPSLFMAAAYSMQSCKNGVQVQCDSLKEFTDGLDEGQKALFGLTLLGLQGSSLAPYSP